MQKQSGFTVIEIIVVIIICITVGVLFTQQKANIEKVDRDRQRKTAINAMYYSLEEVYYRANNTYPAKIDKTILPSMDPALFIDPDGKSLNDTESDYHYSPLNCEGNTCRSYTLRTVLENEADYIKKSVH